MFKCQVSGHPYLEMHTSKAEIQIKPYHTYIIKCTNTIEHTHIHTPRHTHTHTHTHTQTETHTYIVAGRLKQTENQWETTGSTKFYGNPLQNVPSKVTE